MSTVQCAVIDTGNANTASIVISLRAHGISSARVTTSIEDIVHSPLVVLPGVGTFGQTMETLRGKKYGYAYCIICDFGN